MAAFKVRSLVLSSLMVVNLVPGAALALSPPYSASFCETFGTIANAINSQFATRSSKVSEVKASQNQTLAARQAAADAKLAAARAKAEANATNHFTALESEAKTDAQKQAVAAFRARINAALSARRAAVDAANADFRAGISSSVSVHDSRVEAAVATFKVDLAAAFRAAQASCAAGAAPQTVHETLLSGLKAARDKLQNTIRSLDQAKTSTTPLTTAHREAIAAADAAFRASVQTAATELKAALK